MLSNNLVTDIENTFKSSNSFTTLLNKVPNLFASLENQEINNSNGRKDLQFLFDLKKIDEVNESQDDNKTLIPPSIHNSEAVMNQSSSKNLMQVFRGDITCFKDENVIRISNYNFKVEDPSKQTENSNVLFFKKDNSTNPCNFSSMNFNKEEKQEQNLFNKQDSILDNTNAINDTTMNLNHNDSIVNKENLILTNIQEKKDESMIRDSTQGTNMMLIDFSNKLKEDQLLAEDSRTYNIEASKLDITHDKVNNDKIHDPENDDFETSRILQVSKEKINIPTVKEKGPLMSMIIIDKNGKYEDWSNIRASNDHDVMLTKSKNKTDVYEKDLPAPANTSRSNMKKSFQEKSFEMLLDEHYIEKNRSLSNNLNKTNEKNGGKVRQNSSGIHSRALSKNKKNDKGQERTSLNSISTLSRKSRSNKKQSFSRKFDPKTPQQSQTNSISKPRQCSKSKDIPENVGKKQSKSSVSSNAKARNVPRDQSPNLFAAQRSDLRSKLAKKTAETSKNNTLSSNNTLNIVESEPCCNHLHNRQPYKNAYSHVTSRYKQSFNKSSRSTSQNKSDVNQTSVSNKKNVQKKISITQNPNKQNFTASIKKQKDICVNNSYKGDDQNVHSIVNNSIEEKQFTAPHDNIYNSDIKNEQVYVELHESSFNNKMKRSDYLGINNSIHSNMNREMGRNSSAKKFTDLLNPDNSRISNDTAKKDNFRKCINQSDLVNQHTVSNTQNDAVELDYQYHEEELRYTEQTMERMDQITEENIESEVTTKRNNDPHLRNNSNMKDELQYNEELQLIDNFENNPEQAELLFDEICNDQNQRATDEIIRDDENAFNMNNDVEEEITNNQRELEENYNYDPNAFIETSENRDGIESYVHLQSNYCRTYGESGIGNGSPMNINSDPRDTRKTSDRNIKHLPYKIDNENIEEENSEESLNNDDQQALYEDNKINFEQRPKTARQYSSSNVSNYGNGESNTFNDVLNNNSKIYSPENQNSCNQPSIKNTISKKTIKVQPKNIPINTTNYSSNQTDNSNIERERWVYKNSKASFYENKSSKSPYNESKISKKSNKTTERNRSKSNCQKKGKQFKDLTNAYCTASSKGRKDISLSPINPKTKNLRNRE